MRRVIYAIPDQPRERVIVGGVIVIPALLPRLNDFPAIKVAPPPKDIFLIAVKLIVIVPAAAFITPCAAEPPSIKFTLPGDPLLFSAVTVCVTPTPKDKLNGATKVSAAKVLPPLIVAPVAPEVLGPNETML
jgi:hypothetical protein